MKFKVKDGYEITYKRFGLFKKSLPVTYSNWDKPTKSRKRIFNAFDIPLGEAISQYFLLYCPPILTQFNLVFIEVTTDEGDKCRVIELMDIKVRNGFQRKNIGTQAIKILDDIALDNNCSFIIGDLEDDDNIEARKRFFQKNGYKVYQHKNAKFSGWAIRKDLKP